MDARRVFQGAHFVTVARDAALGVVGRHVEGVLRTAVAAIPFHQLLAHANAGIFVAVMTGTVRSVRITAARHAAKVARAQAIEAMLALVASMMQISKF